MWRGSFRRSRPSAWIASSRSAPLIWITLSSNSWSTTTARDRTPALAIGQRPVRLARLTQTTWGESRASAGWEARCGTTTVERRRSGFRRLAAKLFKIRQVLWSARRNLALDEGITIHEGNLDSIRFGLVRNRTESRDRAWEHQAARHGSCQIQTRRAQPSLAPSLRRRDRTTSQDRPSSADGREGSLRIPRTPASAHHGACSTSKTL